MYITNLKEAPQFRSKLVDIFFETSNQNNFKSQQEKLNFQEKWLNKYLDLYPQLTFLSVLENTILTGYLTGVLDSIKVEHDMNNVGYYSEIKTLYRNFPAHFHINVSETYHKKGIGSRLVNTFKEVCIRNNIKGIHVITSSNADNRKFYQACGLERIENFTVNEKELVVLGHKFK